MERNFKLVVAYDGTDFHGWQRQLGVRTVQAELEAVLQRVLRHPLHLAGASRTDAGVHAHGQVASVVTSSSIPVENLARALGSRLPPDTALVSATVVPLEFHASRDACGKLYRYRVFNARRRPVETLAQRYVWHVWHPLDLERMCAAAAALVGTHDFAAFRTSRDERPNTERTLSQVVLEELSPRVLSVVVDGNAFMHNMVRILVGTLVDVARDVLPEGTIASALQATERAVAGQTAPAHGLTLQHIDVALPADAGASWPP